MPPQVSRESSGGSALLASRMNEFRLGREGGPVWQKGIHSRMGLTERAFVCVLCWVLFVELSASCWLAHRNLVFDQTEAQAAFCAHGPRGFNEETGFLRQFCSGQNLRRPPLPKT
jgi:hypothetical protein